MSVYIDKFRNNGYNMDVMKIIESDKIELKEKYADSICKDIEAFLNTDGGVIYIGIANDSSIVGVDNIDDISRKISDIITDQIEPSPVDLIKNEIVFVEGKTVLKISVQKGICNLYCIKKYGFSSNGCHLRIGATCKSMTVAQIKIRYQKNFIDNDLMIITPARYGEISFKTLKVYYAEKGYHLDEDSYKKNLNLIMNNGEYNQLAELLSDYNNIPFNVVKFSGLDKSAISEKTNYGSQCILFVYENIRNRLISENVTVVNTKVRPRKDINLYNLDVVNEALLNAIVHNDYNISEPLVSLFIDRLEILSHGGLPKGLTEDEFYKGISKPRNNMLMRVFHDIGLVEHTGHGIPSIIKIYGKEAIEIHETYVNVIIPYDKLVAKAYIDRANVGLNVGLSKIEKEVVNLLIDDGTLTAKDLAGEIKVSTRTIERAFENLQKKDIIIRNGSKRDGKWIVIN